MPTNNHKPHDGKRRSIAPRHGTSLQAVELLDVFAHMITTTVREAVFDWLEAHKPDIVDAFRGNGEFELANRPLPYHRLSLRLSKGLRAMNVTTFKDIVTIGKRELRRIKGLGTTCVDELEEILREYGVPADMWDYGL